MIQGLSTMLAFFTIFLLLAALALLVLVSLSVPIIHSIYLFRLGIRVSSFSSNGNSILFGLWGYCVTAINASISGSQAGTISCTPRHLGYTFAPALLNLLNINSRTSNIITRAITVALI